MHPSQRKQNNNVDETWIDKARKAARYSWHVMLCLIMYVRVIWGGMHYLMPYGSEVSYGVQVFDASGQDTRMVE